MVSSRQHYISSGTRRDYTVCSYPPKQSPGLSETSAVFRWQASHYSIIYQTSFMALYFYCAAAVDINVYFYVGTVGETSKAKLII